VRLIYRELGITTLDGLREAAETHRLQHLRGLSDRTEQLVLSGIEAVRERARDRRILLHQAKTLVDEISSALVDVLGVQRIVPAGSYRRRKETIGDLDLLAESDEGTAVVDRFATLPSVEAVINRGSHKAAVKLGGRGPQVDLMLMPPGQAGTHLIHFTG